MLSAFTGTYEPEEVEYHAGLLGVESAPRRVCSPEIAVYQYGRQP